MILNKIDEVGNLIYHPSVGGFPGPPLLSIDRAEIAVLIGPLVPDVDAVVGEKLDVGVALQEPEKFVDNPFQEHFLGCEKGESVLEIEPHLVAEDALRPDPGAVGLDNSVLTDVPQQI